MAVPAIIYGAGVKAAKAAPWLGHTIAGLWGAGKYQSQEREKEA